jgi:hypothetical protein
MLEFLSLFYHEISKLLELEAALADANDTLECAKRTRSGDNCLRKAIDCLKNAAKTTLSNFPIFFLRKQENSATAQQVY